MIVIQINSMLLTKKHSEFFVKDIEICTWKYLEKLIMISKAFFLQTHH